jgi:hypothetical protein
MFSPTFVSTMDKAFKPFGSRYGSLDGLSKEGLILYAPVSNGMVDTIGLSASELWAALPTTHRSIYLVDENTLRSAEDITTNIEASEYLNDGGELIGTEDKGYAQYADGTAESVLRKAYRYFRVFYPAYLYFGADQVLFGTDGVSL